MKFHALNPYPMSLFIFTDVKEFNRVTKAGARASIRAAVYYDDEVPHQLCVIMNLQEQNTAELIYLSACHEAVHIWQYVRDLIGEAKPAKEQEAYFVEHVAGLIAKEALSQLQKREQKGLDAASKKNRAVIEAVAKRVAQEMV